MLVLPRGGVQGTNRGRHDCAAVEPRDALNQAIDGARFGLAVPVRETQERLQTLGDRLLVRRRHAAPPIVSGNQHLGKKAANFFDRVVLGVVVSDQNLN